MIVTVVVSARVLLVVLVTISRASPPVRRPDLLFFGLVVVGNAVFYSTFFRSYRKWQLFLFSCVFLNLFEHCSSISHPKMLVFTALVLLVLLNFLIFCCFLKSRFSCPKPEDQNEGFFGHILIIVFIQTVGKESIHVQNLMPSMV